MPSWRTAATLLLTGVLPAAPAQAQGSAELLVEETAGIRRTAFPLEARLEIEQGRLGAATGLHLVDAGAEVPVQGTTRTRWPDGSVRELHVAFNASLAPKELRTLELRYGDPSPPAAPPRNGLDLSEGPEGVQVGRIRLGASDPGLRSVAYREELVVEGRNGIAVLDDRGRWYRGDEIVWEAAEIAERGPLRVTIVYRGRLAIGDGDTADLQVELRMPNSKSWLEISALVADPERRVRAVAIETPLHLGAYPWTWDFATPNGTYGALRDGGASAVLTLEADSGAWRAFVGETGREAPYEEGTEAAPRDATWVHLVGAREAVAFAVRIAAEDGTLTARLAGTGQTSFQVETARPVDAVGLTLFQHYVASPVPIGAATSPASILRPPRVTVR